ncbi:hypothetical protein Ocin01_08699 [Orchesella cincta]|uniref:Uncharacterized protein n=1 Tax=Orchesella cincta TaxID=48709 RepID=A0A1D2MYA3_ORCCI|nr:hypothetical protein Ocin01_08699 [Orchesella cincta]
MSTTGQDVRKMKRKSVHWSRLLVRFQYDLGAGSILKTSLVTIKIVRANSSTDLTVGPISKGHPSLVIPFRLGGFDSCRLCNLWTASIYTHSSSSS